MCGQYNIATETEALAARLHTEVLASLVSPSYDAVPSQGLPSSEHAPVDDRKKLLGISARLGGDSGHDSLLPAGVVPEYPSHGENTQLAETLCMLHIARQ